MLAGQATDVVLDLNSGTGAAGGNLQIVYAAFRGDGVYFSPNRGQVWNLMTGGIGDPLIRDNDCHEPTAVTVTPPATPPTGRRGGSSCHPRRADGHRQRDLQYQGWLYALVATPAATRRPYMTKDFGQNWTRVRIPTLPPVPNPNGGAAAPQEVPTNDTSLADYDPLVSAPGLPAQGNYDIAIAVDPTNPRVVYLGGMAGGGLIRVDMTFLNDAHAVVPFDENKPDGGKNSTATAGGVTLKAPADPNKRSPRRTSTSTRPAPTAKIQRSIICIRPPIGKRGKNSRSLCSCMVAAERIIMHHCAIA